MSGFVCPSAGKIRTMVFGALPVASRAAWLEPVKAAPVLKVYQDAYHQFVSERVAVTTRASKTVLIGWGVAGRVDAFPNEPGYFGEPYCHTLVYLDDEGKRCNFRLAGFAGNRSFAVVQQMQTGGTLSILVNFGDRTAGVLHVTVPQSADGLHPALVRQDAAELIEM